MKLIIAGSRILKPTTTQIQWLIEHFNLKPTEVVCGEAFGVDTSGKWWAFKNSIPVASFPADWDNYGKRAGHIRNKQMAVYGDALLIIWDGSSKGSSNMKQTMIKLGKPVYEVIDNGQIFEVLK